MTWKFVELLNQLIIVYFYSRILIACDCHLAVFLKLNCSIIRVISFTKKIKKPNITIVLEVPLHCRVAIRDLGVLIECKLHFHHYVDFLFSHVMNLLRLIHNITCSFSTIHSLLMQYFVLSMSQLKYASVAWTSITLQTQRNLITHKVQAFVTIEFFLTI